MATITTINALDLITNSRAVINTNFANLNSEKAEKSSNLSDMTVPNTALNNILPTQTTFAGKVLGTDGANTSWVDPSGAAKATQSVQGITALSVAAADPALPKAVGDNDPRVPTQNENDALAGTGTPSSSNKFVTADTDALKELLSNKATSTSLGTSDSLYPSQNAVKSYVDLKTLVSTDFEASGRFTSLASGGSNTFNTSGLVLDTTSTTTRCAGVTWQITPLLNNNSLVTTGAIVNMWTQAGRFATGSAFMGIGAVTVAGTGHTFTNKHVGFKLVGNATSSQLFATQADGSTENASSALVTFDSNDKVVLELAFVVNASSVDYYYRTGADSGVWTKVNLTSNMPSMTSSDPGVMQFSIANDSTALQSFLTMVGASYKR
jgi:hypothetical protein